MTWSLVSPADCAWLTMKFMATPAKLITRLLRWLIVGCLSPQFLQRCQPFSFVQALMFIATLKMIVAFCSTTISRCYLRTIRCWGPHMVTICGWWSRLHSIVMNLRNLCFGAGSSTMSSPMVHLRVGLTPLAILPVWWILQSSEHNLGYQIQKFHVLLQLSTTLHIEEARPLTFAGGPLCSPLSSAISCMDNVWIMSLVASSASRKNFWGQSTLSILLRKIFLNFKKMYSTSPELAPWARELHEHWDRLATIGPGAVERLARLETWFTDHLNYQRWSPYPRRDFGTAMPCTGKKSQLKHLWRHHIIPEAEIEFHLVTPLPEDASGQIIGQLMIVQRPQRFQRSIVLSIYDSDYDRGRAHSLALVMARAVSTCSPWWLWRELTEDCPPEAAHNVWYPLVRCPPVLLQLSVAYASHGHAFSVGSWARARGDIITQPLQPPILSDAWLKFPARLLCRPSLAIKQTPHNGSQSYPEHFRIWLQWNAKMRGLLPTSLLGISMLLSVKVVFKAEHWGFETNHWSGSGPLLNAGGIRLTALFLPISFGLRLLHLPLWLSIPSGMFW